MNDCSADDPLQGATATTALTVTWAATSHTEADRMPIGKVYAPVGKWGVTAAVQRPGAANTYALEVVAYRDLEELADDILARSQSGCWTIVGGAPRLDLDLTFLHRRLGSNFTDMATTTYVIDVDGMLPSRGQDLSRPEDFGDPVVDVFRARLAKAGVKSLANAKLVLLATASSGFPINSRGEPANGRAWFRIILELSSPLTLGQQKAFTAALGKLPGFQSTDPGKTTCLDTDIHSLAGNIFVAPVQGIADPIETRVRTFPTLLEAADAVDVDQLAKELKFIDGAPPIEPEAPRKPKGERVMQATPEKREALLSALMKALPNEKGFDRKKWVGVAHAIWGAADGADWGYDLWSEWSLRWPGGDDPLDRERTWNTLPVGENGAGYLVGWARNVGTPDALAAVQSIELALFEPIENDGDGDDGDDDDDDDDDQKPKLAKLIPHVFVTGKVRPPREFLVKQGWIPMKKVTLLQGDGGDGKSLLMQQLQSSCATGLPWVGIPVEECISAGFYTEDDDEDVEERQDAIDGFYGQHCADTGKMHVFERDGKKNEIVVFDRNRRPELTPFYRQMVETVMDLKARLLVLDVAVDLYGGNEIVRPEVRALFRPLKALARKMNGAVVMTTHVSQSGIKSDGGHSGSTDWSNASRSRLYLNRPKDDKGNLLDPFARLLTRKKANYATIGDTVPLRWHNGLLVRDGAYEEDLNRPAAEEVFLAILDAVNAEGQKVTSKVNGNYAPRLFMLRPALDRHGYQRADFERAMQRLLQTGAIKIVPYGSPSDKAQMLVRTPLTATEEEEVF
jgi:AAA domain/Primase C terminal 2 (PriCT-2)